MQYDGIFTIFRFYDHKHNDACTSVPGYNSLAPCVSKIDQYVVFGHVHVFSWVFKSQLTKLIVLATNEGCLELMP